MLLYTYSRRERENKSVFTRELEDNLSFSVRVKSVIYIAEYVCSFIY